MVPTNTPIPTGLSIDSQVPLNTKEYFILESVLIDLGVNDEFAYTYYKGMPAYCAETNKSYKWKEVEGSEVGLCPSNFVYPDGWTAEGIDYSNKIYNFIENNTGTDQNNYVRQLIIGTDQIEDISLFYIIDYILALPEAERTVAETDSKWNIIIGAPAEGGYYPIIVYELQNIGKGIITELENENFLLLRPQDVSWDNVMTKNPDLINSHFTEVMQGWSVLSNNGIGTANGFILILSEDSAPDIPIYTLGAGLGQTDTERSLAFYSDRTLFTDGLNEKGIEYSDDYSSNFTDNSLITKKFVINELNKSNQKIITHPTDFSGTDYTLLASDHDKLIIIKNGATNVTITVPTGLAVEHFTALLRQGTGEITITPSGTTIESFDGLRINGRFQQVALDRELSTTTFYLTGNTKV